MVLQYKCPDCGDDMEFDTNSGMLFCKSCGRKDRIENYTDYPTFSEEDGKQYQCKNCGAVLITDRDTTATKCSFCGAAMILGDRLSGELAPQKVIPFKISKQEAQTAFVKWCKNGYLTPKGFMTGERIKSITGIYVPFWLYDFNGKGEIKATGTKIHRYERGNYIYTETKYYDISRKVELNYQKVPADASEKMNDDLMDKLEPYDYNELKDFQTPYLAGYVAEKYNYTEKELLNRVKPRIETYMSDYIQGTIQGYVTVNITQKHFLIEEERVYYTLFPVWMVCYDYQHSEHIFAMNGQTGKIVGKPPLSKGKITTWFISISAISYIILALIIFIIGGIW